MVDGETCILCGRYVARPGAPDPSPPAVSKPRWTRAGVVRAIRAFMFFHDRPPSEAEWLAHTGATWPTARAVAHLFGTFDDGLAAAGVPRRHKGTAGRRHAQAGVPGSVDLI